MAAAAAATTDAAAAGEDLPALKNAVRRDIIRSLKALSAEDMAAQSAAIAARVAASRAFRAASSVGIYIHCAKLREVDTMLVLEAALSQGKRVYVPLVDDRESNMRLLHIESTAELTPAPPFGILEPKREHPDGSPRENVMEIARPLDLLLMPGLGFDPQGGRLGRGGGYYDKYVRGLLERAAANGWKPPLLMALSFEQQLRREGVPMEPHDQRVDALATPHALHVCSAAGRAAEEAA